MRVDTKGEVLYMSEGMIKTTKDTILSEVKPENAFHFFSEVGIYTGISALSLPQFSEILKTVDVKSIEFHLQRGDFEKWIRFLGENILALQLARIRKKAPQGEILREKICDVVSKRVEKLRSELPP
jgi:hypothetical protein